MSALSFAVAMGSNEGDRQAYLERALARIARISGIDIEATSALYESAGWGRDDLSPFLNAVISGHAEGHTAAGFLTLLRRIEDELGRQRSVRWGARTLDLDLLDFGGERHESEELTLPHPWISKRPFVYIPFREVAGDNEAWRELCRADPEAIAIEGDTLRSELGTDVWGRRGSGNAQAVALCRTEDDTLALGRRLARFLLPGDTVALNAPMGAGKSVFARGIARGLGIEGPIQSPSYTLCRTYDVATGPFEHWDFYRLESPDDLESTGFSDSPPDAIRAIEWSSHFPEDVLGEVFEVTLSIQADQSRRIEISRYHDALPFAISNLFESRGRA